MIAGTSIDECAALSAQQEYDEAVAAEDRAEREWEDKQEYRANRCPPRE